tara:strand:+ start:164 stop:715 length:552 start_codon:yes stop_codon:yes gene_type:complete
MKFTLTKIKDLIVLEPKIFEDDRGYFLESYNQKKFEEIVGKVLFVQDNESKSSFGVIRGLHFQKPPFDQAKLVRCSEGKVLDVALDLRKKSETYGEYFTILLSSENKKQLFIPRGFAHGFIVLSEFAIFNYKVDNVYVPNYDSGICWDDPTLNIHWGIDESQILVSEKDSKLSLFSEFKSPFI